MPSEKEWKELSKKIDDANKGISLTDAEIEKIKEGVAIRATYLKEVDKLIQDIEKKPEEERENEKRVLEDKELSYKDLIKVREGAQKDIASLGKQVEKLDVDKQKQLETYYKGKLDETKNKAPSRWDTFTGAKGTFWMDQEKFKKRSKFMQGLLNFVTSSTFIGVVAGLFLSFMFGPLGLLVGAAIVGAGIGGKMWQQRRAENEFRKPLKAMRKALAKDAISHKSQEFEQSRQQAKNQIETVANKVKKGLIEKITEKKQVIENLKEISKLQKKIKDIEKQDSKKTNPELQTKMNELNERIKNLVSKFPDSVKGKYESFILKKVDEKGKIIGGGGDVNGLIKSNLQELDALNSRLVEVSATKNAGKQRVDFAAKQANERLNEGRDTLVDAFRPRKEHVNKDGIARPEIGVDKVKEKAATISDEIYGRAKPKISEQSDKTAASISDIGKIYGIKVESAPNSGSVSPTPGAGTPPQNPSGLTK